MSLTVGEVQDIVATVAAKQHDPEVAHMREDEAFRTVLSAIATGDCADPAGCARAVLVTSGIDFARWYT